MGDRGSSGSTVTSRIRRWRTCNSLRYSTRARHALGPTQLPRQGVLGDASQGLQRRRHEADHIPPSSAEVKNECSYCTFTGSSSENLPQTVRPRWPDSSASVSEQYIGNSQSDRTEIMQRHHNKHQHRGHLNDSNIIKFNKKHLLERYKIKMHNTRKQNYMHIQSYITVNG